MPGVRNHALTSNRYTQNCRLPLYVIILGLLFALALLISLNSEGGPAIEDNIPDHVSQSLESSILLMPTVEFINGSEIIWQIPNHPKAVLFIAHGCHGTALNFWDRGSTCPKCVGLPEEKQIVQYALTQNFGVLTVTSSDTCWSSGNERIRVAEIIKSWAQNNSLINVPLFGLGASAGGYFLSLLAKEVKFRGIVLMISSGMFDRMKIPDDYPATLFVHMPKDIRRARKVERHIDLLRKKGVEAKETKCMAFSLTPDWLADRISGLDQPTSSKLFKLFRDKNFIDERGFMKEDGRVTPWREALKQSNIVLPYGSKLMHHIEEELNLAYGYHEMTSLQSDQIFEWFKSHIS